MSVASRNRVPSFGVAEQAKEDRRRNVVGKIPDDPQRLPLSSQRIVEVDVEEIARDHADVGGHARRQGGREIAVDFHCDDPRDTRGKCAGQRAASGPISRKVSSGAGAMA